MSTEQALQFIKLLRASQETVLRPTREAAGLAVLWRKSEPAPTASILGIGRADVASHQCGALGIAILGSIAAQAYRSGIESSLDAAAGVTEAASESIGASELLISCRST